MDDFIEKEVKKEIRKVQIEETIKLGIEFNVSKETIINRLVTYGLSEHEAVEYYEKYINSLHMLYEELYEKVYNKSLADGFDEKYAEHYATNFTEGFKEGERKLGELISKLMNDSRNDDALKAATDEVARKKFYEEYDMID